MVFAGDEDRIVAAANNRRRSLESAVVYYEVTENTLMESLMLSINDLTDQTYVLVCSAWTSRMADTIEANSNRVIEWHLL